MKLQLMLIVVLTGCASAPREGETTYRGADLLSPAEVAVAKRRPDFTRHIKPILEARCVICHNKRTLPGVVSFETRTEALKAGSLGTPIVPGHPERSTLIDSLGPVHANLNVMPTVGARTTENEIAALRQWIAQGAEWPAGKAGRLNVAP